MYKIGYRIDSNQLELLKIKNLSKNYGKKEVLNNISFELNKGEIISIVGKNGIGKSTFLKIIDCISPYKEGEYVLNSKIRIFGNCNSPFFYNNLSGRENLVEILDKIDVGDFNLLISSFNMKSFIDIKVKKYSTGMRQRLCNSLVFLSNADLMIFDEPTSGLDPDSFEIFLNLCKYFNKKGHTIIFTTHIYYKLNDVSNKIYTLNNNKLELFTDLGKDNLYNSSTRYYLTFKSIATKKIITKIVKKYNDENKLTISFDYTFFQYQELMKRVKEEYPNIGFTTENIYVSEE